MGQQKKYMQLYDEMVKLIQTGKLAPGDRLPTEQELSHTFAAVSYTHLDVYKRQMHCGRQRIPSCR